MKSGGERYFSHSFLFFPSFLFFLSLSNYSLKNNIQEIQGNEGNKDNTRKGCLFLSLFSFHHTFDCMAIAI